MILSLLRCSSEGDWFWYREVWSPATKLQSQLSTLIEFYQNFLALLLCSSVVLHPHMEIQSQWWGVRPLALIVGAGEVLNQILAGSSLLEASRRLPNVETLAIVVLFLDFRFGLIDILFSFYTISTVTLAAELSLQWVIFFLQRGTFSFQLMQLKN